MKPELILESPAKINLDLFITGYNADADMHTLDSLVAPVTIYDRLYFFKKPPNAQKVIPMAPLMGDAPRDYYEANIIEKALLAFIQKSGKGGDISITLEKRIPVGTGLGGGASNAANALKGLNYIFDFPLKKDDLLEMCRELGADTSLFIETRPAIMTGFGERLEFIDEMPRLHLLFCVPNLIIPTALVYKLFKETNGGNFESAPVKSERLGFKSATNNLKAAADMAITKLIADEKYTRAFKKAFEGCGGNLISEMSSVLQNESPLFTGLTGSGGAVFAAYEDIRARNTSLVKLKKELKSDDFHNRWYYLAASINNPQ